MLADMLSDLEDLATATSWMARASCADADPDTFFPEERCSPRDAKAICAGCPVRQECLQYAIGNDIQSGVWGGLTLRERRRVKRLRLAA